MSNEPEVRCDHLQVFNHFANGVTDVEQQRSVQREEEFGTQGHHSVQEVGDREVEEEKVHPADLATTLGDRDDAASVREHGEEDHPRKDVHVHRSENHAGWIIFQGSKDV